MAPTYILSTETRYDSNSKETVKFVTRSEVYWDINEVILVMLTGIVLLFLLWTITTLIKLLLWWKAMKLTGTKWRMFALKVMDSAGNNDSPSKEEEEYGVSSL